MLSGDVISSGGHVVVRGSGDVDLGRLDQDTLQLLVAGSGSAKAEGRVKTLKLSVAGSGNADLGRLAVEDADVVVAGHGDVAIAPSGDVKITILGSGDVKLLSRPNHITRSVVGSGHIIEMP